MTSYRFSTLALAAILVSAGGAQAQSSVVTAVGEVDFPSLFNLLITHPLVRFCGLTTPQHYKAPINEGGPAVRAFRCGNAPGKVFSIDTDGGSWRAAAVRNSTTFNATIIGPTLKKARYLDLSACPLAPTNGTLGNPATCMPVPPNGPAAKPIGSVSQNPLGLTAPVDVDLGFADIDTSFLFGLGGTDLGTSLNLPPAGGEITTVFPIMGPTGSGGTVTSIRWEMGKVLGIAASRQLIELMMIDQGITPATRPECYNIDNTANLAPGVAQNCAPVISKDQYRSISTYTFSGLNLSGDSLLRSPGPSLPAINLMRRSPGSSLQTATNAYFQGVGCSPYYYTPADGLDPNVTENLAVGDVLAGLSIPGVLSIGVVSADSVPSSTPAVGSNNQNWGFLKLAEGSEAGAIAGISGGWPSQIAATRGLYDFWYLGGPIVFKKSNETNSDANLMFTVIGSLSTPNAYFTPTAGKFYLDPVPPTSTTTRGTGTGLVPNGSYYRRAGISGLCIGALHY